MNRKQFVCTLVLIGSTAAWSVGCVAHAQVGAHGEADAPVAFRSQPTLVEINSDVWVVREHERAVYYTSGYYWVHRDGTWWRAQAYDGSWARVEANTVPGPIASLDHQAYVNYRGPESARTRPAPRENLASDSTPGREHDNRGNPPEHAAAQHGGPPGQNDVPGLGNQRKAEGDQPGKSDDKPNPSPPKADDKKADKPNPPPGKSDDKPNPPPGRSDDKKGGPKKK
jgi:hypothetical protein